MPADADVPRRQKSVASQLSSVEEGDEAGSSARSKEQEEKDRRLNELYAFIPSGLTNQQLERYLSLLPKDRVFENSDKGYKLHHRQVLKQMPLHDAEADACGELTPEEMQQLGKMAQDLETAGGQGSVVEASDGKHRGACGGCSREIGDGELVILAEHLPGKRWHPNCFTCSTCKDHLIDLRYFHKDGKIYCGRHYAERSFPRCGGCDELILSDRVVVAQGRKWHTNHFRCLRCDKPMGADKAEEDFADHKGQPYCLPCYETHVANTCQVCRKAIRAGQEQLSAGEHHWHLDCFNCLTCKNKLDAGKFLMSDDKLICHSCYAEKFGKNCAACGLKITDKSLGAGDKSWHPDCFVCVVCKESLIGKSFVSPEKGICCVPCHEKERKRVCGICGQAITTGQGGLSLRDKFYHESCFVCSSCQIGLQTNPFLVVEGSFTCQSCYDKKHARQCYGCEQPITKQSGKGSFVSVGESAWHEDCFRCNDCNKVLGDDDFKFTNAVLACRQGCS